MYKQIVRWLQDAGADEPDPTWGTLQPRAEVLAVNQRRLSDLLKELPSVVGAWYMTKGQLPTPPWDVTNPRDIVFSRLEAAGLLDFRPLKNNEIITWMDHIDLWPKDMPHTVDLQGLGLTEEDVRRKRDQVQRAHENERRRNVSLPLDGVQVSFEQDGAIEIIRRINVNLPTDAALLPRTVALLKEAIDRSHRKSDRPTDNGGRGHIERMSPEQRNLVGFIGEWIAYLALQHAYRIGPPNWVSSNRARLFDGNGINDSAGYDFFVETRRGRRYFEVKATVGSESFVRLGQTEIDFAQQQADQRESFRILLVTNALDSASRQLLWLPNPFGPRGHGRYRLRQGELQLFFQLDK
ncbi:MAG: DUF3883 domain-containing protein [Deltaproteobacteria bacterium]|nr:DUF3883 domain-containing protein [Deltaproteobacteria bacterium]